MKHLSRKITCTLLLTSMLLSMQACGGEAVSSDTTTAPAGDTTTAEPEYQLPEADFGGETFNVYLWSLSKLPVEEENGDILNDAIYARNCAVEDLYNFKFSYTLSDGAGAYDTWITTLNASVMAGDDSVQLAGGYGYRLTAQTLDGSWANLLEIPEIDFTQEWWLQNLQEAGNLGGAMYFIFGNIDADFYNNLYTIYFNKKMAESYSLPDLYDMVRDGKWTLDKLIEFTSVAGSDLNGDSQMIDEEDQFGYMTDVFMGIDAFITASDITFTQDAADQTPELLPLSDKYVALSDKLTRFLVNNENVSLFSTGEAVLPAFNEGRLLFMGNTLACSAAMRDKDTDFGIIPYPKWDETQENYGSFLAVDNVTTYIIPITADASKAGTILNALAYYGYNDVLPIYYEKSLKGKGIRDDESGEMLDIIFDNIRFDFTQIYNISFGIDRSPFHLLRYCVANDTGMASRWESMASIHASTMEKLIATLK